jgi:hypothetical protein
MRPPRSTQTTLPSTWRASTGSSQDFNASPRNINDDTSPRILPIFTTLWAITPRWFLQRMMSPRLISLGATGVTVIFSPSRMVGAMLLPVA